MPKKHKHVFTNVKSSNDYVHPSLGKGNNKVNTPVSPPGPVGVSERLQQLRIEQGGCKSLEEISDLSGEYTQRSSTVDVINVLGLQELTCSRSANRPLIRLRSRIPGPAPPKSWTENSSGYDGIGRRQAGLRSRPKQPCQFIIDIGQDAPDAKSLVHVCLKKIAEEWKCMDEDILSFLQTCPQTIRKSLVGYISFYGTEDGLSARELGYLIGSGRGTCSTLDLQGLIGWSISMKELINIVGRLKKSSSSLDDYKDDISNSWGDDEHDIQNTMSPSIPTSVYPQLITKLSLGDTPSTISWNDLLTLTTHLSSLTHLDLSSWPYPTRVPNLIHTTISSMGYTVEASSEKYSSLDNNYQQASSVLRQLAKNTHRLEHLILRNCSWYHALLPPASRSSDSSWSNVTVSSKPQGPGWTTSWSLLSTLVLSHASPESLPIIPLFPAFSAFTPSHEKKTDVQESLIRYLFSHPVYRAGFPFGFLLSDMNLRNETPSEARGGVKVWRNITLYGNKCNSCGGIIGNDKECIVCKNILENGMLVFRDWLSREEDAIRVGLEIRKLRKEVAGMKWLRLDFGWRAI